nr:serine/threonine-protein kinase [Saccharomonospora piscinae]
MSDGSDGSDGDGTLIAGRYRLDSRVGSGAMGVVWRAVDVRLDRTVAVKQLLLPPGLNDTETEKARQRAFREGRIAARLQHPNAISVYNVADHEGHPVLVMEYLPSRSLSDVLGERGTLPPQDVARFGAQVAAALTAAHEAGVIHRDVKPGNVLLADDGTAKITDFGISRAAGDITVTSTGLLAGTPAFLSPETARGAEPGPAADVFSLGATLYAAVEGRPPFENPGNEIAMLHLVASGKVIPPRQAGVLDGPLRAMLHPEPHARPAMADVESSLHAVAEGRPVEPPTLPATPARPATRVDLQPAAVAAVPAPSSPPGAAPGPPAAHTTQHAPHPPSGQPAAPAESRGGWSRARVVTTALAVLAAAAVGILVAELLVSGSGEDDSAGASPPATGASAVTTAAGESQGDSAASQTTTSAQSPPSSPSAESQTASPQELEQAVADYYALLPGDVDQAWERLGPGLREQGKDSYRGFWSGVDQIVISGGPNAVGENTVEVTLDFLMPDGDVIREVHRLGTLARDGQVLIDTDETVSIVDLGAADSGGSGDGEDDGDNDGDEDGDGDGDDG